MEDPRDTYVSTTEAAQILAITPKAAGLLARKGKIPAAKIANRWLIARAFLEEFAKTYDGRKGWPRKNASAPREVRNATPSKGGTVRKGIN